MIAKVKTSSSLSLSVHVMIKLTDLPGAAANENAVVSFYVRHYEACYKLINVLGTVFVTTKLMNTMPCTMRYEA